MNFTELENSILKELDNYINLWSIDGYGDALDNRIVAMRIAKKIVQEKIEIAKNWHGDELPEQEQVCSTCDNGSTPCFGQVYCKRNVCWMPQNADCLDWCAE